MKFSILLILLGLVGCATSPSPTPTPTATPTPQASAPVPTPTPTPQPAQWKPTGDGWLGQQTANGRVVWFRTIRTGDCGPYRYCLNYEVTTEAGCDSLYVQASLTNADGQNVDWTNDTVQGLRPKETGLISLGATQAGTFRLDEVSCR